MYELYFDEEDYIRTGIGMIRADEQVRYSDRELDKMYPFDPIEDNPWTEEELKALKNQQVRVVDFSSGKS